MMSNCSLVNAMECMTLVFYDLRFCKNIPHILLELLMTESHVIAVWDSRVIGNAAQDVSRH